MIFLLLHPLTFYLAYIARFARHPSFLGCLVSNRLWVALDAACGLSHMHNSTPKVDGESDLVVVVVCVKIQGNPQTPTWMSRWKLVNG